MNRMLSPRLAVSFFLLLAWFVITVGCSDADVVSTPDEVAAGERAKPLAQPSAQSIRVIKVPQGGIVPDAEIDGEGVVHVAYLADDDIYYVKSSDQGQTFSAPLRVNSEAKFAAGGAHRGPDLAVGKNGRIHVVWYNAGYQQKRPKDQCGVMYSHLDPKQNAFEPTRNINHKPSDNFSLAADKQGNVAVVWMAGGVFANRSGDGGASFSSPVDLKTDPCECCGSRAIYASNGSLSVLYRDKADNIRDTYLAFLPKQAAEFTHVKTSQTLWPITSCPMTGSFLSTDGKGLIAGWETKQKIYFTRLDNQGQRLSSGEILAADRGRYPVTLRSADGTTLVAWKNGKQIQWKSFDAQDVPTGKSGSITCATEDRPSGVVTSGGQFLLFP